MFFRRREDREDDVVRAPRRWRRAVACALLAVACGPDRTPARAAPDAATAPVIQATDDGGHVLRLRAPARRVIALIPSATETVIALGAADRVVGRTRYDVAPEVAHLPSVGGGIDPSVEAIVKLHPDLVLAREHDERPHVRAKLVALGVPVFSLRTSDTADVFRGIANVGRLIGRDSAAAALAASLRRELEEVRRSVADRAPRSAFYVVYNDPPMTAGPDTFIAQLIGVAGGRSIFADVRQLWPTVAVEEIVRRQPDVVIVPTGEFRANAVDRLRDMPGWRDLRAVRDGHVVAVPADLVSRPGPHIGEAARALRAALHPELAGDSSAARAAGSARR